MSEEVKTADTRPSCDCCRDGTQPEFLRRAIESHPRALDLHDKLLSIGGKCVILVPTGSRFYKLDDLLDRGQEWDGKKSLLRRGSECHCHENAGRYWAASMGHLKIASGYALSDDGMWRQHSWNLRADGYVLESTEPRLKYYGIIPDEVDSFAFFVSNVFPTKIREMAERMEAGRSLT